VKALAKDAGAQATVHRQIAAAAAQLDRLVYHLYSLTEDEIQVVEGVAE
jgi:hypothetical protein